MENENELQNPHLVILYNSIQSFARTRRVTRRLTDLRIDSQDVVHEIWLSLHTYVQNTQIGNMNAFVNYWGPKLIHRIIDQEAKHHQAMIFGRSPDAQNQE